MEQAADRKWHSLLLAVQEDLASRKAAEALQCPPQVRVEGGHTVASP
jgi:hypothetical protein